MIKPSVSARWTEEALRLHHRYQMEIVEGCGLCPWAVRSRLDGKLRARVLLHSDADLEPSLKTISELAADPDAEVALLLYPRLRFNRPEFEQFVARMRDVDARRHALGTIPFVMAAFHPDAAPDVTTAERLVPFLRRTPDPAVQLLRSTVLDRIRNGAPQGTQFVDVMTLTPQSEELKPPPMQLRERIARANLATALEMGVHELGEIASAIIRDREETYRAIENEERTQPHAAPSGGS